MTNPFYVYEMLHPITLLPFYVGKGKGDRVMYHVNTYHRASEIKSNPLKCSVIRKIIEDLNLHPLYRITPCSTNEVACSLEQSLIEKYGQIILKTGTLTNIAKGGEGGATKFVPIHKYTLDGQYLESFTSISEAIINVPNVTSAASSISNCAGGRTQSALGHIWSYELHECIPGRKPSGKLKQVHQYDKTGNFLATFNSPEQAAKAVNGNKSSIQNAANPKIKQKSAHGFLWSYQPLEQLDAWIHNLIKAVTQHDKQGNLIAEFASIADASKATGIDQGNISACCSGTLKTAGRFIWKQAA